MVEVRSVCASRAGTLHPSFQLHGVGAPVVTRLLMMGAPTLGTGKRIPWRGPHCKGWGDGPRGGVVCVAWRPIARRMYSFSF